MVPVLGLLPHKLQASCPESQAREESHFQYSGKKRYEVFLAIHRNPCSGGREQDKGNGRAWRGIKRSVWRRGEGKGGVSRVGRRAGEMEWGMEGGEEKARVVCALHARSDKAAAHRYPLTPVAAGSDPSCMKCHTWRKLSQTCLKENSKNDREESKREKSSIGNSLRCIPFHTHLFVKPSRPPSFLRSLSSIRPPTSLPLSSSPAPLPPSHRASPLPGSAM